MKRFYFLLFIFTTFIVLFLFTLVIPPASINFDSYFYQKISQKIQNLSFRVLRSDDAVRRRFESLSEFEFIISEKNLNDLDTLYSRYEDPNYGMYSQNPKKGYGLDYYSKNNKRFDAKLVYESDTLLVRVKSHGKQPDLHRYKSFISLNIKSDSKIKSFDENKFKLIIYERVNYRKNYDEILAIANLFDLEFIPSTLINVKFKDFGEHLYYLEYSLNNDNLKKVFPSKNFFFFKGLDGNIILDNSKKQLKSLNKLRNSKDSVVYNKIISLNKDIKEGNRDSILTYFDFDYITNFETFRTISGLTGHGLEGENLELFYNLDDSKFYPIVHRDFFFGIIDTCGVNLNCLEKYRWDGGDNYGDDLTLFKLIRNNPKVKETVKNKITSFLKTKQNIIEKLKDIKNEHEIRHYPFYINNMRNLKYTHDPVLDNINFLEKIN